DETGPDPPLLFAGSGIERRQESARRAVAARDAGVDHAVVIKRRCRDRVAVLPAADLRLPELLAGLGIERHHVAVEIAEEYFAVADRDAAIVPTAADCVDALIDVGAMLPNERAGLGIEREHVVVAGRDVHDAVTDDRRALERIFRAKPGAEVHHPGPLESLHVVAIDLRQGRIAGIAPIAADREPL